MARGALSDRSRLEAFSDGVLAIAITLLTLDLRVPAREAVGEGSLARALAERWPSYTAYVVSFLVIGIIWVNHHALFRQVRLVDRPLLFANLLLLMVAAAIPFPTALLAEYLTAGKPNASTAAVIYSLTMVVMSLAFQLVYLTAAREGLLREGLDPATVRRRLRRFGVGLVLYAGTVGIALLSAPVTLAAHFLIALYYCFDQLTTRRTRDEVDAP
jgi:uncharacterized membrane protein